jgi:N-acetylmuramoyl-L-alanine amidase
LRPMRVRLAPFAILAAACGARTPAPVGVSPVTGPLAIAVAYPRPTDVIQAHDTSFIFGSVTRADARVTVNGSPVTVHPSGGWLAWVPVPEDTLGHFVVHAVSGGDSVTLDYVARIAPRFHPPADHAAWIDTLSFSPRGEWWLPMGEGLRLSVLAAPGALVRLRTPWGTSVPLLPDPLVPPAVGRYVGWLPAARLGAPGALVPQRGIADSAAPRDTLRALVEAIVGADTARTSWPLHIGLVDLEHPTVVRLRDDTVATATPDSLTVGKALPNGTYHWFFPAGTSAVVSGRAGDQLRLRLSRTASTWINVVEAEVQPPGTPPPGGVVGSVRLVPGQAAVTLRVPLPARVPFQVTEEERRLTVRLYGVAADINWMYYGGTDPLVARMSYRQETVDEVTVDVDLSKRVFGYRSRWDGHDLILEIRRPPVIDARQPLRGRVIAVDPGHPPAGAIGPTGFREAQANLAVSLKVRDLLTSMGARVVLIRDRDTALSLYERTALAERENAEVLVSIHNNALPDGVNPFENHGTSVYYFHPRSAPLARHLDRALVAELGLPDLGMARGDYALVRPTWMPSALTEGLFLMLPDQEAVLRSEAGQLRYARGVVRGIEEFLRDLARDP